MCAYVRTYVRTHVTGCRDVTIHRTIDLSGQSIVKLSQIVQ